MKSRAFVFVVIFGIGAIAVGWVYESRLRPQPKQVELVVPDNIDYFLTQFTYRSMNPEGALDYEFSSPRLEHYPRDDTSQIEIPSLQIFRDPDRWQIESATGKFQHQPNLLRLQNRVIMRRLGDEAFALYTDSIRFEPDRDLVIIESPLLMQTVSGRIEADTASFDLADQVYRFNRARALYNNEQG